MQFQAYDSQRLWRRECFRLVVASLPGVLGQSAAGCPEGTFRCQVIKNATGDYTIQFNTAFVRTPVVSIVPLHATLKLVPTIVSRTTSSVRFSVFVSSTGTLTDATEVDVVVQGADTADQVG